MALILGKVVDVLVTAYGFFVVEIAPTCQLSGWRPLGDPSVDSILFVTRPIHGICAGASSPGCFQVPSRRPRGS